MRKLLNLTAPLLILGFSACTPPQIKPENPGLENANFEVAQACISQSTGGNVSSAEVLGTIAMIGQIGADGRTAEEFGEDLDEASGDAARNNNNLRVARQLSGIYNCLTQAANVTSYGAAYYINSIMAYDNGRWDQEDLDGVVPRLSPELRAALKRYNFI